MNNSLLPLKRTANAGVVKRMSSFLSKKYPNGLRTTKPLAVKSHPSLLAAEVILQIVVVRKAGDGA